MRKLEIWKNAVIITVAAVVAKILSAVYRIPYQNIAGDVGFYVYQQVYPFYSFVFTLSLYGLPLALAKVIAEQKIKNSSFPAEQYVFSVMKRLFFLALLLSAALFCFAPLLAKWMGDVHLLPLLQIVSLSFLALPFLAGLRGYFQGLENMTPTAVSQIIEQSVRVVFILLLAAYFVAHGGGAYGAGKGAVIGSVIGAYGSAFFLIGYYLKATKRKRPDGRVFDGGAYVKKVLANGFLFSLSSLVLVLYQLADSFTLVRLLAEHGFALEMAKAVKGTFDRGQPLLQLATLIVTSFSLALVPLIAKEVAKKNIEKVRAYGERALRFTLFLGLCASVGLALIIEPVNAMLFMNRNGSFALFVLSFAIVFSSIIVTTTAMMQGFGRMNIVLLHLAVGLAGKLILNFIFVPKIGIAGASLATVISLAAAALLNVFYIFRKKWANIPPLRTILAIGATVGAMTAALELWKYVGEHYLFSPSRMGEAGLAFSGVAIGVLVVFFLTIRLQIFTYEEVRSIPLLQSIYKKFQRNKECRN